MPSLHPRPYHPLRQAQRALSDVTYLGWRFRQGEIAWDVTADAPLLCHEPLIDPDLFWYCFDHLFPERPSWAPQRSERVMTVARPRRVMDLDPKVSVFSRRNVCGARCASDHMLLDGCTLRMAHRTCLVTEALLTRRTIIAIAPTW
jgi:hypothetical protein